MNNPNEMIRRFYIVPLRPNASEADVNDMLRAMRDSDRFIPGLIDSAAGVDFDSRTVIWENSFVDEASYSGPYMVHPYHSGSLDDFLMADSPRCITHDIYTTRYAFDALPFRLTRGIRRLVLMKLAEQADIAALEAIAAAGDGMTTSILRPDAVGYVSYKGRAWTHVWEQTFADTAALDRYLATSAGMNRSSVEALQRLDIEIEALNIFTYPFELSPAAAPRDLAPDTVPILYTITARTAAEDADTYLDLLRTLYDPYVADAGGRLVHRLRTVEHGYAETEITSAWELASMAAYSDVRLKTVSDPRWSRFVAEAVPLVRGGTRRFSHRA